MTNLSESRLGFAERLIIAIPLLFLVVFFLGPLVWLILMSVSTQTGTSAPKLTFTLSNFVRFLGDAFYLEKSVWLTFKLAFLSACLALVIGYPIAYFIANSNRMRTLLIILVVVPLWVNIVVRIFGWGILLMDNGLVNTVLIHTGLLSRPFKMMYQEAGVLIGLTQICIPYIVLPILGALQGVDRTLIEAAESVGSNRWHAFWKITFPLSIPGVAAGTLITFSLNASAFAIPAMMGGMRVRMMGLMAYEQAATLGNYPVAAAIGVSLFVLSMVSVILYLSILRRAFRMG